MGRGTTRGIAGLLVAAVQAGGCGPSPSVSCLGCLALGLDYD